MKKDFYNWMELHREENHHELLQFEKQCKKLYGENILDQWVRWTEKLKKTGFYR